MGQYSTRARLCADVMLVVRGSGVSAASPDVMTHSSLPSVDRISPNCASTRGLPVSTHEMRTMSSCCAMTAALSIDSTRRRSAKVVRAHCFCNRRPRATASATAAGDVTGTSPRNCSVAGL